MLKLWTFWQISYFLPFLMNVECFKLQGFKFGETKVPWSQDPNTGYAEVNVSISSELTICAWVYADSFSTAPSKF